MTVVPLEKLYVAHSAFNYQRMDVGPAHASEGPARSNPEQPLSTPAFKRGSQHQTSIVTTPN